MDRTGVDATQMSCKRCVVYWSVQRSHNLMRETSPAVGMSLLARKDGLAIPRYDRLRFAFLGVSANKFSRQYACATPQVSNRSWALEDVSEAVNWDMRISVRVGWILSSHSDAYVLFLVREAIEPFKITLRWSSRSAFSYLWSSLKISNSIRF